MRMPSSSIRITRQRRPIWRRSKRRSSGLRNIPRKNVRHRRSNRRTRKRKIQIRSRTEVISNNKTSSNHRKINSNNRVRARISNNKRISSSNRKIDNHKTNRAAVKSNKTRTINLKRRTNFSNRSNKTNLRRHLPQENENKIRTGLVEVPNNLPRLVKTAMKHLRPRQETARKQAEMRRLLSLHRGRRRKNSRAT